MTADFYVYIDEAGDEGFGKLRNPEGTGQSRWLLLGAAIVSRANDALLPNWRDEIMGVFPKKRRRDLHFRYLGHDQRVYACNYLSKCKVGLCVVASNKVTILDSPKSDIFKEKQHLYNYLVRFLLERVTEACALALRKRGKNAGKIAVTFSRRGGTDYQSMRDYLMLMRNGREVIRPVRSIDWSVLNPEDIRVENHSHRAGLQIADVLTSATAAALEPNYYGNIEPRYALTLCDRFLRGRDGVLNCGLTLIPPLPRNPLSDEQRGFISELERKCGPPGP